MKANAPTTTAQKEVRAAKREAALLAARAKSLSAKIRRNTLTGATIRFI